MKGLPIDPGEAATLLRVIGPYLYLLLPAGGFHEIQAACEKATGCSYNMYFDPETHRLNIVKVAGPICCYDARSGDRIVDFKTFQPQPSNFEKHMQQTQDDAPLTMAEALDKIQYYRSQCKTLSAINNRADERISTAEKNSKAATELYRGALESRDTWHNKVTASERELRALTSANEFLRSQNLSLSQDCNAKADAVTCERALRRQAEANLDNEKLLGAINKAKLEKIAGILAGTSLCKALREIEGVLHQ